MQTFDIARLQWSGVKIAHCRYSPWEAREFSSVSEPGSIGVAFTPQVGAVVRRAGAARSERRDVAANSVGLCGAAPLDWLRTPAPSDVLEITARATLRAEIAQAMGVAEHADLDDLHGWLDPTVLATALRFRAAARGWSALSDVARDELVRAVYAHVYRLKFGGRWPANAPTALSPQRLGNVVDWVHAHLADELSIAALAQAAALSPFHFARAFKTSTGMTPHRFVTVLRLQRAEQLLTQTDASVEDIAAKVGYSNVSHFRRMFRRQLGALPSVLRGRR